MRKKMGILFIVFLVVMLEVCMTGCSQSEDAAKAAEDEIKLTIQLDLKEDIGLLILDNNLNGVETSGGISNADKTTLKHDEVLDWTLSKQEYENPAETVNLSVRFRVITEYCDPNYENDYPEEYTILTDAISFTASFGETYSITITGDNANGYQAVLNEP